MSEIVAIYLRGHERDTFKKKQLINFLLLLKKNDIIFHIYIHTWHKSEARLSWRRLSNNGELINLKKINDYFSELDQDIIKNITIEDDTLINIIGLTDGVVCKSLMPIIGWKRMWAGIMTGAEIINKAPYIYKCILNIRIDNFQCYQSQISGMNEFNIINEIKKFDIKEKFFFFELNYGVDNCFIATPDMHYKLIKYFNYELDEITKKPENCDCRNQEFLVYTEALNIKKIENLNIIDLSLDTLSL